MKTTTTKVFERYYDSAITLPTIDEANAFMEAHPAYGAIQEGDAGVTVARLSDEGYEIFKLNAYGNGREVLAKRTKAHGLGPIGYVNQTQAYKAKAKQVHPEKWSVIGNNPYRIARVDLAGDFADTVEGFRASITRVAEIAGLPVLEVYEMWRRYAQESENSDQSAILGEFVDWNAGDLKPAGMDKLTAKELLNKAIAA